MCAYIRFLLLKRSRKIAGHFLLFSILLCGSSPAQVSRKATQSDEEMAIDEMLDALRQAMRPAANMQVKVTDEVVAPHGAVIGAGKPDKPPPRRKTIDYTVTISGLRSRIESHEAWYEGDDSAEPSRLFDGVSVFDGSTYRRLTTTAQAGSPEKQKGLQSAFDHNTTTLCDKIYGFPINLNDPNKLAEWELKLAHSGTDEMYVLEATYGASESASTYRLTLDGERGFNLVKAERIFPNGKTDYEVDVALEEIEDGVWYPAERTVTKYSSFHGGEPIVTNRIFLTDFALNVEIPEDAFRLVFPLGMKVWDEIVGDWFEVGRMPVNDKADFLQIPDANRPREREVVSGESAKDEQIPSDSRTIDSSSEDVRDNAQDAGSRAWWVVLLITAVIVVVLLRRKQSAAK